MKFGILGTLIKVRNKEVTVLLEVSALYFETGITLMTKQKTHLNLNEFIDLISLNLTQE